jgi:hypothetical protein
VNIRLRGIAAALGLLVMLVVCVSLFGQRVPDEPFLGITIPPTTNSGDFVTVFKPNIVAASASLRCGGDIYKVSTGTSTGHCVTTKNPDGIVASITCSDQGGSASASCSEKGVGACDGSSGAGACDIR